MRGTAEGSSSMQCSIASTLSEARISWITEMGALLMQHALNDESVEKSGREVAATTDAFDNHDHGFFQDFHATQGPVTQGCRTFLDTGIRIEC